MRRIAWLKVAWIAALCISSGVVFAAYFQPDLMVAVWSGLLLCF